MSFLVLQRTLIWVERATGERQRDHVEVSKAEGSRVHGTSGRRRQHNGIRHELEAAAVSHTPLSSLPLVRLP